MTNGPYIILPTPPSAETETLVFHKNSSTMFPGFYPHISTLIFHNSFICWFNPPQNIGFHIPHESTSTPNPQLPDLPAPQIPIAGGPLDRQHLRRPRAARRATAILAEAHGVVGGVELLEAVDLLVECRTQPPKNG